jgi:hypothetical protein
MSNVISGVFCFAKVTEPAFKYESDTEKEFSIQVVVDEDTFDTFGETYGKQKGKAIKTADFEGIFKIKPPYPNDKKQFVLKLAKGATYKSKETGQLVNVEKKYWPKIMVLENNQPTPIEEGILIANGSKGQVSFEENTNSYGTFAKLKNILVEELIEYKKTGEDAAGDFGYSTKVQGSEDFKPAAKVATKPAVKASKKVEEDDSDLSPF